MVSVVKIYNLEDAKIIDVDNIYVEIMGNSQPNEVYVDHVIYPKET